MRYYNDIIGKVMTVKGPIEPEALGAVLMHEHLYGDIRATEERPILPERETLLMEYAVPNLKALNNYGCHAFCDASIPPIRAWPDTYIKVSEAADVNIILATGYYREIPEGSYLSETNWSFMKKGTVEELTEFLLSEFEYGINKSSVKPGVIKLGSTTSNLTPAESRSIRAGARAQKETGVHITTHAAYYPRFFISPDTPKTQLKLIESEGVDARRVVLGHTAWHLVNQPEMVRELMRKGAVFLPTNLRMDEEWEFWEQFVNSIRQLFQEGFGDHIVLGLDWAFENEQGPFVPCTFMPPPPYVYMFTHALPQLRKLGLEEEAIQHMLVENPKRIIPVQKT